MEPLIIVYYYDEGHNVFVTIEFFPHIDVIMTESTKFPLPRHTRTSKSEHFPKFI